jgi:hypothetical protein
MSRFVDNCPLFNTYPTAKAPKETGRDRSDNLFQVVVLVITLVASIGTGSAQTWEYLGLPGRIITAVAVRNTDTIYASAHSDFPPKPGSVFRTTTAGAIWDTVVFDGSILDLKIHPRNPEVLYAGYGGSIYGPYGVLKTTNGGISWFHADSGIIADGDRGVRVIEFDPVNPDTIYLGTAGPGGGNIYKSMNGGANWIRLGDGTLLEYGTTAIAVHPESTQTLYAGSVLGMSLLKTTDGGLTWQTTGLQDISVVELAIDRVNPLLIYAGVEFPAGGAMRSTDGGVSWTVANMGLPGSSGLGDVVIHPTSRIIYAAVVGTSEGGAFQSADSAETWMGMGGLPNENSFHCVTLSPDSRDLYFGISDDGVYRTSLTTHVVEPVSPPDRTVVLYPNYPNPFNASTLIQYELATAAKINITVYDIVGGEVANLVSRITPPGRHSFRFDGAGLPTGTYLCRMSTASGISAIAKLLIIR